MSRPWPANSLPLLRPWPSRNGYHSRSQAAIEQLKHSLHAARHSSSGRATTTGSAASPHKGGNLDVQVVVLIRLNP